MAAGGIRFGVWVNLSLKGFRLKTVDFPEAGMSTDVPRPLSGASVAVRNIFVPYRFVCNTSGGVGGVTAVDGDGSNSAAELVSVGEASQKVIL